LFLIFISCKAYGEKPAQHIKQPEKHWLWPLKILLILLTSNGWPKEKIRNSQLKAAVKVNTEMLMLYWEMGKELTGKQAQSNWGDKIITQLAKDLSSEFPGMKGFSRTNIFNIVKWYRFYSAAAQLIQQPVGLKENKQSTACRPNSPTSRWTNARNTGPGTMGPSYPGYYKSS
jgi:hypothetical protein